MIEKILIKALIQPSKVTTFLCQLRQAQRLLAIKDVSLFVYCAKLFTSRKFYNYMKDAIETAHGICPDPKFGGWMDFIHGFLIYSIVRHAKPTVVVETGVGPGGTSSFILKGLEDNGHGVLYSIDLPGNDAIVYPHLGKLFNIHVPEGYEVGWLVPPYLKHRWKLIIGDSQEKLPELLHSIKNVDIFLHDSLHTDEHVLMEFETVLPYVSNNSVLLCDDVNEYWSLAFIRFCESKKIPYIRFNNRLGIARSHFITS